MSTLSLGLVEEAACFLNSRVLRTPLVKCDPLTGQMGVPVYLKLEFLQTTGSFKLRGALFRLSRLGEHDQRKGIITCSAGNHGWAIAHAARLLRIPSTVYVPSGADRAKVKGIASLGAHVIRSRYAGYDETEKLAISQSRALNLTFVSPYDDFSIMAANGGTLAKEILEENPKIRTFLVPVGGGGLAAGLGFYVKSQFPDSVLVACQHSQSPALKLSLERGAAVTELPPIQTLAVGIEGGIGTLTFSVLKNIVDELVLLTETEIIDAVRWVLMEHRYLIEPSSAVTLAALLTGKLSQVKSPSVVVLTGRNIAYERLQRILCRDWSED